MGRIIAQTTITNRFDDDKSVQCGMLVDTGAGAPILPQSWKPRLIRFQGSEYEVVLWGAVVAVLVLVTGLTIGHFKKA